MPLRHATTIALVMLCCAAASAKEAAPDQTAHRSTPSRSGRQACDDHYCEALPGGSRTGHRRRWSIWLREGTLSRRMIKVG